MKRLVLAAVIIASVATACGGSSGTLKAGTPTATHSHTAVTTDKGTVRAAVKRMGRGLNTLRHLNGTSLVAIQTEADLAQGDFAQAAQLLSPTPRGVPVNLARATALDLQSMNGAIDAVGKCYRQSLLAPGNPCSVLTSRIQRDHEAVLADALRLAPYTGESLEQLGVNVS